MLEPTLKSLRSSALTELKEIKNRSELYSIENILIIKKKWNLFLKEAPLILLFIDQTHKEFDQAELFPNPELNLQTT